MTLGVVQLTQTTLNPTSSISTGSTIKLRGWYSQSFIAGDGASVVEGGNGQAGFYYDIECSLNGSGLVVIPAFDIWATTLSNPTANFFAQLYVDGAPGQMVIPNTPGASGWQIPTLYGDTITFAELALYNRAKRLLYPDNQYLTRDQTIILIQQLAGNFDFMAVGINGIGSIDTAPDNPALPVVIGTNSRRASDFYNIIAYGAATSKTAGQNAIAIAAAVTAATVTGGGIYIPVGTFATNSVTISVPVEFSPGASILSPATGQTVTITKAITADASKHFANATAGLGTISFSGNDFITQVWAAWWGALTSATATVNAAAFNAANQAVITFRSGEILLGPGAYEFNSTFNLGDDASPFSGVSLSGTNGLVGTFLRWTGSTSGTAIYCTYARFSHIRDFQLDSLVARGTSIGLRISGPQFGTNNSGVMIQGIDVRNFHIGGLAGDGTGAGHDASEITIIGGTFESNDIGFKSDGSNTLNINFYNTNFDSNTTYGLQMQSNMCFYGGSFGRNGISFALGAAQYFISGIRDEAVSADYQFIVGPSQNPTSITVVACNIASTTIFNNPLITSSGTVNLIGNYFAFGSNPMVPFGGVFDGSNTSLTMSGNIVNENASLFQYSVVTGEANGLRYSLLGNRKVADNGNDAGPWPEEIGVINWPNRSSMTVVGSGIAGTSITAPQITSNQNNYSPLNTNGAPAVLPGAPMYLRLSTDASRNVTGLTFTTPQVDGQTITVINVGSFNIVLVHQSGLSTATNRFLNDTGADITLIPNERALLEYDATTARWRAVKLLASLAAPGAIGGTTPAAGAFTALSGTTLSLTQREAFPPTVPAQITANQNNYNPGGNSVYLRLTSDVSRNVTGLTFTTPQTDGEVHTIVNIGLADIVLKHQDGASTATNRFFNSTAADITLTPKQAADVLYDTTNGYWLCYKRA